MIWVHLDWGQRSGIAPCYNRKFMVQLFIAVLAALRGFFRSRSDTALEILAPRQQVAVLKRQRPRPPLNSGDRFFWITLRRFWSRWADVLLIVKPETVVGGIAPAFGFIGAGGLVSAVIGRLAQENPPGALANFTRSCRSWLFPCGTNRGPISASRGSAW
jgi:hypothetical protein